MSKRILITGGAGFIGSHLCEKLLKEGNEVISVDNYFTGRKKNIQHLLKNPKFEMIRHDIVKEFQKLKQAQANSDKLVKTETIAMNAVKGLYDDGKGNFTIKGAANKELAIRLMHDKDYHTEKAKIMKPIDGFFELLDTRTKGLVESAKEHFL